MSATKDAVKVEETAATVAIKETLNDVLTFDEALAASGLALEDTIAIFNPYTVLNKDKDALLNKPFFIRFIRNTADKDTGALYVVFYCVTRDNEMFVVTDGSTGIYEQLQTLMAKTGRDHSFMIANGLRKSDYTAPNGQPATTYYLA